MSRSNNTEYARNPSTRWFEWAGGADGGYVRWYDKEEQKQRPVEGDFTFLLLDELATVKGWHDASESAIYANEVRDTRQDVLLVRSFKGGELASGLYPNIRDRIKAVGGHFHASCYIAYKDGDELRIGNLGFKGAALSAWMEFKKSCGDKTNGDGKKARAYYVDAVNIAGYKDGRKGGTAFRIPTFALARVSNETNHQAIALDAELQSFLKDYLGRTRTEQVAAPEATPPPTDADAPAFVDDDIPF